MTTTTTKILLSLALLLSLAVPAVAQTEAPAAGGGEYHSPLRATWRDEVRKDPGLKADIEGALRESVHQRESSAFTRNNRHVILAYAAIWVLTMGFVAFVWLRQGKLTAEIERLRGDLARATKDAS